MVRLRPSLPHAIASAVVLLLAGNLMASYRSWISLDALLSQGLTQQVAQEGRSQWTDQFGLAHEVVTPRLPREAPGAWANRHDEVVATMQATFPPRNNR